ncbi:SRPBCC family protein [Ferruginibacter sp.]
MKQTIYELAANSDKTLLVQRQFDATPEMVWKAWTDSEILAEWWAPTPFKAITKSMDFREGGRWHYYMLGPDGSKFWCMVDYLTIDLMKKFTARDFFCDEEGNKNNELPGMHWENVFTAVDNGTKVSVTVTFNSKEDLDKIVSMGFKEGFAMAHENLDKVLAEDSK